MKVFIDTNVILEYFMHREKYEVAEKGGRGSLTSVSRGGVREQVKLLCAAYYDIIYMSRFCYD